VTVEAQDEVFVETNRTLPPGASGGVSNTIDRPGADRFTVSTIDGTQNSTVWEITTCNSIVYLQIYISDQGRSNFDPNGGPWFPPRRVHHHVVRFAVRASRHEESSIHWRKRNSEIPYPSVRCSFSYSSWLGDAVDPCRTTTVLCVSPPRNVSWNE